jgi:copper chaperone CopZ
VGQTLHREEIARVNVVSPYIHVLNGRLRVKVAEIKGLPKKALEVEGQVQKIDGITHVRANPTTGNVLVLYDPARVGQFEILGALQRLGYLRENGSIRMEGRSHPRAFEGLFSEAMAETLVRTTMELAVQRFVSALI